MTRSSLVQLLCPVLVGRVDEFDALCAAFEPACSGQSGAVCLSGEAGIGKSRLCLALADYAVERGGGIVTCHMEAQPEAAFAPVIDGIKRAARRARLEQLPVVGCSETVRDVLSSLFPELVPLPDESTRRHRSREEAGFVPRRLFEATVAALDALAPSVCATSSPLLLILEDLHWADSRTAEFLRFLLHAAMRGNYGGMRSSLLVVATYRNDAIPEASVLTRVLDEVYAQRLAQRIPVNGLSMDDHARLVTETLGQMAPPELVSLLYEHDDGNPFVAEELMGAMALSGHLVREGEHWHVKPHATLHLPLSLRTSVLNRLAQLTTETRTVLSAAAVIGREFRFGTLQAVTDLDETAILDALRQAVSIQLLEEADREVSLAGDADDERYRFRHALTREVVRSDMLSRERRALHRRVADVLLAESDQTDCDQSRVVECGTLSDLLSYHLVQAGYPRRAAPYALVSAERSLRLGGPAQAIPHFRTALSGMSPAEPERVDTLMRLGVMYVAMTDLDTAGRMYDQARLEAASLGLEWKVDVELGVLLWFHDPLRWRQAPTAILLSAHARRCLDLRTDVDTRRLYGCAALVTAVDGTLSSGEYTPGRWADLALSYAVADENVSTSMMWGAMLARGVSRIDGGDRDGGIDDLRRVLALGRVNAIPDAVIICHLLLVKSLHQTGLDEPAISFAVEAAEWAAGWGVTLLSPASIYAAVCRGAWAEAGQAAETQLSWSRQHNLPIFEDTVLAAMGHLAYLRGQMEAAAHCFEEAWRRLEGITIFAVAAPCLWGMARIHAARGEYDDAVAVYSRLHVWSMRSGDWGTATPVLLDECLFLIARGDLRAARLRCDDLDNLGRRTGNPIALAAGAEVNGLLNLRSGRAGDAACCLRAASEAWNALERPYDEARSSTALAEAELGKQARDPVQRALAGDLLHRCIQTFERLGAAEASRQAQEVRRKAGLLTPAKRRRTVAGHRHPLDALTPRERDVLEVLAAGHTNRQIARALFIAESTAALHVSRILGKLDCATRAQAAAYAVKASQDTVGNGSLYVSATSVSVPL